MAQKKYERKAVVKIIEDRCKGCWYCVNYCPTKVLVVSEKMNTRGYHPPEFRDDGEHVCIACHLCELYCPDFAIVVEELK